MYFMACRPNSIFHITFFSKLTVVFYEQTGPSVGPLLLSASIYSEVRSWHCFVLWMQFMDSMVTLLPQWGLTDKPMPSWNQRRCNPEEDCGSKFSLRSLLCIWVCLRWQLSLVSNRKHMAAGWGAKSCAGIQDIKEATCLIESLVLLESSNRILFSVNISSYLRINLFQSCLYMSFVHLLQIDFSKWQKDFPNQ